MSCAPAALWSGGAAAPISKADKIIRRFHVSDGCQYRSFAHAVGSNRVGPEAVGLLSGDRPEEAVDQPACVEWQGPTPKRKSDPPPLRAPSIDIREQSDPVSAGHSLRPIDDRRQHAAPTLWAMAAETQVATGAGRGFAVALPHESLHGVAACSRLALVRASTALNATLPIIGPPIIGRSAQPDEWP
jgi:hypothetical protein